MGAVIQVYRVADPSEAEICREMNSRCLQSQPSVRNRNRNWNMYGCSVVSSYTPPAYINAWYLITTDMNCREIFNNLPQDELIYSRKHTSCVQIGSYLYDIGGRGTIESTSFYYSNQIRRLDTENPSDGWKIQKLPFHCMNAAAVALGNFIYLFPKSNPFVKAGETELIASGSEDNTWPGYVYDTIRQEAYKFEPPLPCGSYDYRWHHVCVPLDHPQIGSGLLVPVLGRDRKQQRVYLHKPEVNSWEPLDDYAPIPGAFAGHYAVLNGILYVSDRFEWKKPVLYVYDLRVGRLICKIDIPKISNYNPRGTPLYVVPLSDSELCFLWCQTHTWEEETTIFYVKVSLSLHPPAVTKILNQASFKINKGEILNCMPMTSPM